MLMCQCFETHQWRKPSANRMKFFRIPFVHVLTIRLKVLYAAPQMQRKKRQEEEAGRRGRSEGVGKRTWPCSLTVTARRCGMLQKVKHHRRGPEPHSNQTLHVLVVRAMRAGCVPLQETLKRRVRGSTRALWISRAERFGQSRKVPGTVHTATRHVPQARRHMRAGVKG